MWQKRFLPHTLWLKCSKYSYELFCYGEFIMHWAILTYASSRVVSWSFCVGFFGERPVFSSVLWAHSAGGAFWLKEEHAGEDETLLTATKTISLYVKGMKSLSRLHGWIHHDQTWFMNEYTDKSLECELIMEHDLCIMNTFRLCPIVTLKHIKHWHLIWSGAF